MEHRPFHIFPCENLNGSNLVGGTTKLDGSTLAKSLQGEKPAFTLRTEVRFLGIIVPQAQERVAMVAHNKLGVTAAYLFSSSKNVRCLITVTMQRTFNSAVHWATGNKDSGKAAFVHQPR